MAKLEERQLIDAMLAMRQEAADAKADRMDQNKSNWEIFHLKQDWSYKRKGQSKEFLPKTAMAVEQIASFLQQLSQVISMSSCIRWCLRGWQR